MHALPVRPALLRSLPCPLLPQAEQKAAGKLEVWVHGYHQRAKRARARHQKQLEQLERERAATTLAALVRGKRGRRQAAAIRQKQEQGLDRAKALVVLTTQTTQHAETHAWQTRWRCLPALPPNRCHRPTAAPPTESACR